MGGDDVRQDLLERRAQSPSVPRRAGLSASGCAQGRVRTHRCGGRRQGRLSVADRAARRALSGYGPDAALRPGGGPRHPLSLRVARECGSGRQGNRCDACPGDGPAGRRPRRQFRRGRRQSRRACAVLA